jgi:hypothetical protein
MSGFTDGGSGKTIIPTYRSCFERAVSGFDRCLETMPYEARPRTLESTAP